VTKGETTDHHGHKRIRTTTTTFEPPTRDQVLTRGTTNSFGRVKFFLSPDQLRTTAGTLVTQVDVFDTSNGETVTSVTKETIPETRPDVYFRVTQADGKKFDTRGRTGGFVLNLNSKRIGSAGAPLTFTLVLHEVVAFP
jgi:hypothetical protein